MGGRDVRFAKTEFSFLISHSILLFKKGVVIGNETVKQGILSALFDTGTTFIGVPEEQWVSFAAALIANRRDCSISGIYIVCNPFHGTTNLSNVIFAFGDDASISLTPSQYVYGAYLGFSQITFENDNRWILGHFFLINKLAIFDMKNQQIGVLNDSSVYIPYSSHPIDWLFIFLIALGCILILVLCVMLGLLLWSYR